MRTVFQALAFLALGTSLFATSGCKVACGPDEEEQGSKCVGKSLTKFVGTPVSKQATIQVDGTVAVKGLFGHIKVVQGSNPGKIDVTFQPFDYEGYDEKDLATRQMNENLGLKIIEGAETVVQVERIGESTTGLGADIEVALPSDFTGRLVLDNLGAGTFSSGGESAYDINAAYVASAKEVSLNSPKGISDCTVQGAATVKKTTVTCGDVIKVFGVSDDVTIISKSKGNFDDPSIELSIASISDTAVGGKITVPEGGILATFPATGTYAVQAWAPNGLVDLGTAPTGCVTEEAAAGSKTLTCGTSPKAIYELKTDGVSGPDEVFQQGDIKISYK